MGDNIEDNVLTKDVLLDDPELDCAICLQKCHHPTQLPCGHIFCFLCVKGVAIQSKKCAMCRAQIPPDYLDHPKLLEKLSPQQGNHQEPLVEHQWYYEGRNGWWKYEERSNIELEMAYNNREPECTLLLAGALYSIDFQTMTQIRCTDPTRRRRVKRDTPLFPAKGIAGIKINESQPIEQTKQETDDNTTSDSQDQDEVILVADDDEVVHELEESDNDVEIITTEPVIITVDDASDELARLNIWNTQEPET